MENEKQKVRDLSAGLIGGGIAILLVAVLKGSLEDKTKRNLAYCVGLFSVIAGVYSIKTQK